MKKYLFGIVFIIYILVGCANTHYQNGRDAFDRGDYDIAVKAVSYTHLTLPTTPYV